jgi:hypothetical protein
MSNSKKITVGMFVTFSIQTSDSIPNRINTGEVINIGGDELCAREVKPKESTVYHVVKFEEVISSGKTRKESISRAFPLEKSAKSVLKNLSQRISSGKTLFHK